MTAEAYACRVFLAQQPSTDLTDEAAARAGGFYSSGEFELSMIDSLPGRVMEVGRTCVHADYRSGAVIATLWQGIAACVVNEGYDYLFGCASIELADGTKKSVGVVLPATLTFNTGAPEIMECVAGGCEYKLAGSDEWKAAGPGDRFSVPGHSSFEIRVSEAYHYICHFG